MGVTTNFYDFVDKRHNYYPGAVWNNVEKRLEQDEYIMSRRNTVSVALFKATLSSGL